MKSLLSTSQPHLLFPTCTKPSNDGPAELPTLQKLVQTPRQSRGVSLRSLARHHLKNGPPAFVSKSKAGMISWIPQLCEDGTGGTYFMRDAHGNFVAVFKPEDEDPLSSANPKRRKKGHGFHFKGILPCEGFQREILAYKIGCDFLPVPQTYLAEVSHWIFTNEEGRSGSLRDRSIKRKLGSLQEFVSDVQCTVDDMGTGRFSVNDVQRVAIFDLLIANCDRNGGNLLVKKNTCKLVPIDHAFCLPDFFHLGDIQWFEWLTWRQSKQPVLQEIIEFVNDFDIEAAVAHARDLRIRRECIITLQLCHIFVREAIRAGHTLHEIGKMMCSRPNALSVLEALVSRAYNETLHPGAALISRFEDQVHLHFLSL